MRTKTLNGRETGQAHSRHRRASKVRRHQHLMNGLHEAAKEGAGKVKDAVVDAGEEVWSRLNEAGNEAGMRARDRIGDLRDSASACVEHGRSRAHDFETAIERTIRTQPLTSVMVAAGIGCFIGFLWRRM